MFQHYTCVGIVNSNPELKETASGEKFCRLILAVPQDHERNNWLPIIFRKNMAEYVGKKVKKGFTIHISGYLRMTQGVKEGSRAYIRIYGLYCKILCRPTDTNRIPECYYNEKSPTKSGAIKEQDMADECTYLPDDLPWRK